MKSYTTRDVARLLGLSEAQVRSQARGYLAPDRGPRNAYRFSFQDLVLLRTAKALERGADRPRRIRGARSGAWPASCPPGARSAAPASRPRATGSWCGTGDDAWQPESGQMLLDFEVAELAGAAAPVARRLTHGRAARTSRSARNSGTTLGWISRPRRRTRRVRGVRSGHRARPAARRRAGQSRAAARRRRAPGRGRGPVSRRAGGPAATTRPPPSTWAPRSKSSADGPRRSKRTGARWRRTRTSPTRTSTWPGSTTRPASAPRRSGISRRTDN